MGISYAAVDNSRKEYFKPPKGFNNKIPGLYHPNNPFPGMMVMMNSFGYHFDIENDAAWDCYYDKDYKDITEEVYAKYLEQFLETEDTK